MPKQNTPPHAQDTLRKNILAFFHDNPGKELNYKRISHALQGADREEIKNALHALETEKKITRVSEGKYKLNFTPKTVEGIIDITRSGSGFVMVPGSRQDIFIPQSGLKDALDGDLVKVSLSGRKRGRQEGVILEVLERRQTVFAGVLQLYTNYAFLVPDKQNMHVDIFIPRLDYGQVKNGVKAVARIIDWPPGAKSPVGELIEVLGDAGNHQTEMKAIIYDSGFSPTFPDEVLRECDAIPEVIPEGEAAVRRDMRRIPTFTIDPDDAKDFDDALSVRELTPPGTNPGDRVWEVGIHIADVSHYVRPGSLLDREAVHRATSVYLVDRVLPMFPEKISEFVCSLRPHEDKLCFSAIFNLDSEAKILASWYGRTIIHSANRFTYAGAQEVLDKKSGVFSEELSVLNSLAGKLRENRFKEGAVNFETVEVKFRLNDEGVPIGVYLYERRDSNLLIEDFMLLANRKVAEFVGKPENGTSPPPFVYRVHDLPDMDKLRAFAEFAGKFGYKMRFDSPRQIAASLNKLIEEVEGKPEQNILEQIAVRTMAKAYYTTRNIGHYGLAFPFYTHFTSPIRRYPDVMVHRELDRNLQARSGKTGKGPQGSITEMEKLCQHTSEMERRAQEAERASVKYKQAEYLGSRLGKTFRGIISGVTEWGFYVEIIENKCEGLVRISSLQDDHYVFDEKNYCIVGKKTSRKFSLGDEVDILVKDADPSKRTIDFILPE